MQGKDEQGWSWARSADNPENWDLYDPDGTRRGVYSEVGWKLILVEDGELSTLLMEMCRPTPRMKAKIRFDAVFVTDPRRAVMVLREHLAEV